jgi:hypothetical protein
MTLGSHDVARIRRSRMSLALAVSLIGLGYAAVAATAAERYYRDDLDIRTEPPARYVIEVPEKAAMHGGYFKVTTDAKGRVIRSAFLVDGQSTGETVYEYSGDAVLPTGARYFKQGMLTGITKYTRDASGRVTRSEFYTAQGSLTGYTTTNWVAGHAESANFAPDGVRRWHAEEYYSPAGIEVRSVMHYEGSNTYNESIYDTKRGLVKSSKQYTNGQLQISYTNTYDADDDLVRQDLYSNKGTWYGAKLYEHNLVTKKLYKFSSGATQETYIKYDARRWAESAKFYVNNKLICTFLFEHLPDGTTKRTVAQGPDGSLWAEYPDRYVDEVDRNGHPPNSNLGIIHRAGTWW